jgi:hypothetical protein
MSETLFEALKKAANRAFPAFDFFIDLANNG